MREMKDSGIEWIGEIPCNWKLERSQWHLEEVNISNNPIQTNNVLSLTILGYRKGEDGEPTIVPEEAEIIRDIFQRYIMGDTIRPTQRVFTNKELSN